MIKSRRDFLRSLGIGGAATGAALGLHWGSVSAAYTAEPVRTRQPDGLIRLDSNENAYGPSPRVAGAVRDATGEANRYPFMKYDEVVARIASFHQVKSEQVLIACGSTEILRVAACVFLGNGRQLLQAAPTFEAIEDYAKSLGSEVVSVNLTPRFAHDLDGMLARIGPSTGLVYICNPNNPTASITPRHDLETFIGKLPATVRVVIDEAYHQYAEPSAMYASFIDRPLADDRVIVTRTFSKVFGLAGLRLGYAVASPQVIEKMRAFVTQDGLNAIVAEVAGVALDDAAGVREFVRRNRDDRQEFVNQATDRMLKPIDSATNFVMMDIQHPAVAVIQHFRQHKILIGRHFPPMDNYIRVSLGTPEEMKAFWQTWDLLPWSKKFMHH
jgi:histidinol-phosphate aminotransferase